MCPTPPINRVKPITSATVIIMLAETMNVTRTTHASLRPRKKTGAIPFAAQLVDVTREVTQVIEDDVEGLNRRIREAGLQMIVVPSRPARVTTDSEVAIR